MSEGREGKCYIEVTDEMRAAVKRVNDPDRGCEYHSATHDLANIVIAAPTNPCDDENQPTMREVLTALTNLQEVLWHLEKRVVSLEQWVESESNRQMGDDL